MKILKDIRRHNWSHPNILTRIRLIVKDVLYYIKCRFMPSRQYNRIHIKTLSPTWTDRDAVLVHGMMQILSDFIEKELLCKKDNYFTKFLDSIEAEKEECFQDMMKRQFDTEQELYEIYTWWHEVYLKTDLYEDFYEPKKAEHVCDGSFEKSCEKCDALGFEWMRQEEELEKELDAKCKRLIEIRGRMWT